jgi:hypothetical protein
MPPACEPRAAVRNVVQMPSSGIGPRVANNSATRGGRDARTLLRKQFKARSTYAILDARNIMKNSFKPGLSCERGAAYVDMQGTPPVRRYHLASTS